MKERFLIGVSAAFTLGVFVGIAAKAYSVYGIYIQCGLITWPWC